MIVLLAKEKSSKAQAKCLFNSIDVESLAVSKNFSYLYIVLCMTTSDEDNCEYSDYFILHRNYY